MIDYPLVSSEGLLLDQATAHKNLNAAHDQRNNRVGIRIEVWTSMTVKNDSYRLNSNILNSTQDLTQGPLTDTETKLR